MGKRKIEIEIEIAFARLAYHIINPAISFTITLVFIVGQRDFSFSGIKLGYNCDKISSLPPPSTSTAESINSQTPPNVKTFRTLYFLCVFLCKEFTYQSTFSRQQDIENLMIPNEKWLKKILFDRFEKHLTNLFVFVVFYKLCNLFWLCIL